MSPHSLFSLKDQLDALSQHGDPLEILDRTVDFEYFRGWLVDGLGYGDGSKGGRPPFDPVAMFKILILQTQHNQRPHCFGQFGGRNKLGVQSRSVMVHS